MTDKERFDQIFHSGKHFRDLTDVDFLRSAAECEKLFHYLINDGLEVKEAHDVKKFMHFAFWLGMIERKDYKIK